MILDEEVPVWHLLIILRALHRPPPRCSQGPSISLVMDGRAWGKAGGINQVATMQLVHTRLRNAS